MVKRTFRAEVDFLTAFGKRCTVDVPQYSHISTDHTYGGYRKIKGVDLSPTLYQRLSKKTKANITAQVGEFLTQLHTFPVTHARRLGCLDDEPFHERLSWCLFFYLLLVRHGNLTDKEMAYCDKIVKRLVKRPHTPMHHVTHNDFHSKHLIYSKQRRTLQGVIDFGDMRIGDPANDLGYLWEYGEEFVDAVLDNYDASRSDAMRARSRDYWFFRAMTLLLIGVAEKRLRCWSTGYRLFPDDVADPERKRNPRYGVR